MEGACLGYISDWTTGLKEGLEQPFPELSNLLHEDSPGRASENETTWGDGGGSAHPESSLQRCSGDPRRPTQDRGAQSSLETA